MTKNKGGVTLQEDVTKDKNKNIKENEHKHNNKKVEELK